MTKRFSVSRRRVLAAGLATGVAQAFPSPAIGQARRSLTVQTLGGAIEKTMREEIVPEFQKQHGIEVTLVIEDDVTILPKLRAARGRSPYDVVTCDNPIAILGQEADLWAPDQSARMSNIGAIYKSSRPPLTANYGSIVYEYACVYNTKKMNAPTTWNDLWAPGLAVGVPHISQAYGLTFLYIAALLNGGSEKNLGPGFDAIKRLKNFKVFKNVSQGLQLFQQNEIDVAQFYHHRAQQMVDMGLPIAKTTPKEGIWGQRTGTQIAKAAANMGEAVLWVNNTLSVPYQAAFAKSLYSPTNRNYVVPTELKGKLLTGEQYIDSIREAPWADLLPQRDALLERWTREFGG